MKKILAFSFSLLFCSGLFAQATPSANEMKNFRFGGTVLPSVSWYTPDDLKKFARNGSVVKFGVLINGEYSFSGNFALGFGLGLASAGGKVGFSDTTRYYYSDDAIIKPGDTTGLKGKYSQYKLNNRTYNASYFIIPFSLKMRTNEIGYMRYFFQPGLNIAIRKKVRANDDLTTLPADWPKTGAGGAQSANQTNLDITSDMSFIRLSATITAGGEYYISGSTAIVFSIGYDYGLSNAVKTNSDYLIRTASGNPSNGPVSQKFTQSGVVLSVGVLF
ncbi:MAG: outer membrane beta-barrel protein [Bacteroidia bacterium]